MEHQMYKAIIAVRQIVEPVGSCHPIECGLQLVQRSRIETAF
jgi:hypothetical protein